MKMKMMSTIALFISLVLFQACGEDKSEKNPSRLRSSPTLDRDDEDIDKNSSSKNAAEQQSLCLRLDKGACFQNKNCFFNMVVDKCESKKSLRAKDVVATHNELKVLTKDGYLYKQGLHAVLLQEKALAIAAASDFCEIKEDNSLACEVLNLPPIPPNTKAKQISLNSAQQVLCYIDMNDQINCLGKNNNHVPKLQNGIDWQAGKVIIQDYSDLKFSSVVVGNGEAAACGRLVDNSRIVCFAADSLYLTSKKFLIPLDDTVLSYALLTQQNYYINSTRQLKFNVDDGSEGLSFDSYVAQGTKGIREASSLISGGFTVAKSDGIGSSYYGILCFISNNKVYCSSPVTKNNNLLDLSTFNPVNPEKITLSNNILCSINAGGEFSCTNVTGKRDDRILGFEK